MSLEILLALVALFALLSAGFSGLSAAPWVPARAYDMDRFLKLAQIQPGQTLYDIGCGDGRVLCSAAKVGAFAEGFEISLLLYLIACIRSLFQGNGRVKVHYGDFWKKKLSDADVVYFFLTPKPIPRLVRKFQKELKKGTKVISYTFPIPAWQPMAVDRENNRATLYLYEIGKQ